MFELMIDGQPLVSVIMAMRNASATVRDTIRSLQWQTLSDWELILLDDGSVDSSVRVIESFNDPRIRLFVDGRRMGLAARLNQAVGTARGRFIARMDADDVCFPLRLEKQVAFLEAHPQIDLMASSAVVFSGDEQVGLLPVSLNHDDIVRHPFRGFSFPHPTWCGRAEWFRTNPYDGSLGTAEDQDLLLRSYGHSKFAGIGDVLIGYRQPRLEIGKLLRGRLVFSRSVWRHAGAIGPFVSGINGILSQAVRATVDIVTIGLGLNRWSQRRRLHAVPRDVYDAWLTLRARLQCNQGT
ncbi:glycosyltransferase family 2 protein [Methylocystis sp. B8]|uniref:glycosyltransferase family 2 protein n=1 Tax=Methylocystis sp. B8 TaxID=544938 RepID=UPI0010FDAAA1|nr:glycosyltransferase family 2 protein [Methylocystis sp. B8]TLG77630.1 glycosyltransferase family 2 protein [Methylocystis sp. B8]